jgi:hypothetical protein
MARGQDRIFILGEEALDGEMPGFDRAGEPVSIERERLAAEPDRDDRAPRFALGLYSRRRLGAGAALIGCATLVWLLVRGGPAPKPAVDGLRSPVESPVVRRPAPLTAAPARSGAPSQHPAALTRPGRHRLSNRPNEAAEREPTSEQAPPSPPIDEPAPLVEPADPPAVSSPARAVRAGSGGRPEFGIER